MSDPRPWAADRELTAEMVAAAVDACVPDFAPAAVRLLGWGWDFDAWLVNETWVFRFPRKARFEPELVREVDLLRRLEGLLPLPVPRYEHGPFRADAFRYRFAGYRLLEGKELIYLEPTAERRAAVAEQLGRFLVALHGVPLERLDGLAVTGYLDKADIRAFHARLAKFASAVQGIASPDVVRKTRAFFEGPVAFPPPFEGPPRLRHTDLHPEHILMGAPDQLTITGIIDWSDATVGDPAGDLSELVAWAGESFLDELLAHYPIADPGLRARAHFMATAVSYPGIMWMREMGHDDVARRFAANLDLLLSAYV